MRLLLFIATILIVSIIPVSYALDVSNQQIIGESELGGQIILEWVDNTFRELMTKTIVTANLEFGLIETNDGLVLLDNAETRTYGKSFTVRSYDPSIILFGRGLDNGEFQINSYTVENGKLHKTIFNAEFSEIEQPLVTSGTSIIEPEDKKNLKVIVESSPFGEYYDNYSLRVTVYDADINPNPELGRSNDGRLSGIPITAIMAFDDETIVTLEGETDNFGLYEGKYRWAYQDFRGEYLVSLDVDNGNYVEELNTFYRGFILPSNSTKP